MAMCFDLNIVNAIRLWAEEGRSLSWVGSQLGLSKQRVHQIAEVHDIKFRWLKVVAKKQEG